MPITEKLIRRDAQLTDLVTYIKSTHSDDLRGYPGKDVDVILRLLRQDDLSLDLQQQSVVMSSRSSSTSADPTPTSRPRPRPPARVVSPSAGNVTLVGAAGEAGPGERYNAVDWRYVERGEYDVLHEVAHGLHFASIAMLGFLVLEVRVYSAKPSFQNSNLTITGNMATNVSALSMFLSCLVVTKMHDTCLFLVRADMWTSIHSLCGPIWKIFCL